MLFLSIFGSFVTPYNPIDMDFTARLESPNLKHPLGTDLFGRDVLSNIIGGAKISIYVGFASVILGIGFGAGWGLTRDRKSTRLNSSHVVSSYADFGVNKKRGHQRRC